jgi:hypothetical protein
MTAVKCVILVFWLPFATVTVYETKSDTSDTSDISHESPNSTDMPVKIVVLFISLR